MMDFKWNDISSEAYREYVGTTGYVYRVNNPVGLYLSESGTHYVKDSTGMVHTVQKNAFMVVRWFDADRGVLFVNPSNTAGPVVIPAALA